MSVTKHIASHFNSVHFGGNWTSVNLQDVLKDVSLDEANVKIQGLNSIASLVFHMNYFVKAALKVFREGNLQGVHDKFSFDLPVLNSEEEWEQFKQSVFEDAGLCMTMIEKMDENLLFHDFTEPKYGNYYRNLHGIIEHTHYHLGQIVVIKKLLRERTKPDMQRSH